MLVKIGDGLLVGTDTVERLYGSIDRLLIALEQVTLETEPVVEADRLAEIGQALLLDHVVERDLACRGRLDRLMRLGSLLDDGRFLPLGRFLLGYIGGVPAVVMKGRVHYYEDQLTSYLF